MKSIALVLSALLTVGVSLALPAKADDIGKPGTPNGPPVGISPVTDTRVTMQSLLRAYEEAKGIIAHPTMTDIEQGTISAYGLRGTYRHVYAGLRSGSDYAESESVGPFSSGNGRYHGQRWRRDENGVTDVMQVTAHPEDFFARDFADQAQDTSNDVTLLGEVTSPVDAYVIQVKSKDGSASWGFFDKKTGLLDRIEIGDPDDRGVVTYDDYRVVNGDSEAWHTHYSDKHPENDYDSRITSDVYGAPLTQSELAIPPSTQNVVQFPAGKAQVSIPSDVTVDTESFGLPMVFAFPYITVTINGRGLDMILDSTQTGMLLDDEVAKEIGATRYGPYAVDDKGSIYPTRGIVPALSIGDLEMKNVAVTLTHVNVFDSGRKVVGYVGYDFLANAVVEIDYTHHHITAYDPAQFEPPADAVTTPVNIDGEVPFVSAQIGKSIGDYFMLDDTQPFTVIFPHFWQAHPSDVQDQGQGRGLNFSFFGSKSSKIKATQLKALDFGGVQFSEWTAYEATDTQDLEGADLDGIIGCDFLRYFNVFFDYAQQAIYLEPNDTFKRSVEH